MTQVAQLQRRQVKVAVRMMHGRLAVGGDDGIYYAQGRQPASRDVACRQGTAIEHVPSRASGCAERLHNLWSA